MPFSIHQKKTNSRQTTRVHLFALSSALCLTFAAEAGVIHKPAVHNVTSYGHMTEYGYKLEEKLKNLQADKEHTSTFKNIIYINSKSVISPNQEQEIKNALLRGYIAVIDSTTNHNKATIRSLSARLGGIGFESPIIMIKKNQDGLPEYKELTLHSPYSVPHTSRQSNAHQLDHKKLTDETYIMLQAWLKKPIQYRAKERDNQYRPEVSIPVELRYVGFPCMVGATFTGNGTTGDWSWNDELIDACHNNASVSIFYTVDLIRSIASTAGGADDAKYIRITVDPSSNGGAGWHLIDEPSHKHTWFQSWANRETWFGPIADSYYVTIQSTDPDVHLYNTIPSNHPKESQIMHTIGLQVGVSGGPSLLNPANMGGNNPIGFSGINMGLSFTYTSERAISYNNHEYELINLSRAGNTDKAAWVWSREFGKYAQHWRTNRTCELWCQDWFYDDVAFSAASYSSFTPGFSATFQVPASKDSISTIEFESAIKPVALGGRVQYAFLFQHYTPWGYKGTKYSFKQNLEINWGATFFNAEIPVSIEAYKENSKDGICLEVIDSKTETGSKVGIGDCHFKQNQIWGMDSEFRYKSFLAQDRCLTRKNHDTLTIQPCTHAANQKWEWNNEHITNNLGGALTINNQGHVITCPHTETPTEWRNFIRKPDISGTMTVSTLTVTTDQENAKAIPTNENVAILSSSNLSDTTGEPHKNSDSSQTNHEIQKDNNTNEYLPETWLVEDDASANITENPLITEDMGSIEESSYAQDYDHEDSITGSDHNTTPPSFPMLIKQTNDDD